MAGTLDTAFKEAAKALVSDLGSSLDTKITYTHKKRRPYNVDDGGISYTDLTYADISVPIEYVLSEDEGGQEKREGKVYVTPNLIGSNQPTLQDEIILTFGGESCTAQVTEVRTLKGGQDYLFILMIKF